MLAFPVFRMLQRIEQEQERNEGAASVWLEEVVRSEKHSPGKASYSSACREGVERLRWYHLPRCRTRKLWAILPFAQGMETITRMAPRKRQQAWMDALFPLFPAHYGTQRVAATPHVPRAPTTREWQKLRGFSPCKSVTIRTFMLLV